MHYFYEETLVAYREGELPLFTELPAEKEGVLGNQDPYG